MTPSPVDTQVLHRPADTVHAQQPRSSHRDRLHPPYTHSLTHSHIHTHILTQIHTISHATQTLLIHPHSPSHTPHILHTHTHSSHPHTHILFTHTHTLTYSHPHTLLTHSYTYFSYPHKHTPSHTPYLHTHTHAQSLQEHRQETRRPRGSAHTPGTWSVWKQPRVPAGVSRWTFHTLGATGTPRSSLRRRETAERTQADPARSRPNLTAL